MLVVGNFSNLYVIFCKKFREQKQIPVVSNLYKTYTHV